MKVTQRPTDPVLQTVTIAGWLAASEGEGNGVEQRGSKMTYPISAALIGVVMVLGLCVSCAVIDELARRWRLRE